MLKYIYSEKAEILYLSLYIAIIEVLVSKVLATLTFLYFITKHQQNKDSFPIEILAQGCDYININDHNLVAVWPQFCPYIRTSEVYIPTRLYGKYSTEY